MLAGLVFEVVTTVDPILFAPIFGEYFPYFLIANGLLTEYLSRCREADM